jgi:hypothetical protein
MTYSAVLAGADLAPEVAGRPFADVAGELLAALARPEETRPQAEPVRRLLKAKLIVAMIEPPDGAVMRWRPEGPAEIAELTLNGYPNYAVLTRAAALAEWDRHSRREADRRDVGREVGEFHRGTTIQASGDPPLARGATPYINGPALADSVSQSRLLRLLSLVFIVTPSTAVAWGVMELGDGLRAIGRAPSPWRRRSRPGRSARRRAPL